MEIFLTYLKVFAVGGAICLVGQIFINKTKITPARMLVATMLIGMVLEVSGAFKFMEEFAKAGVTVPIMGFGATLAKGAMEGAKEGILGAITGGLKASAAGITAAVVFGFIFALLFKSKTKKD